MPAAFALIFLCGVGFVAFVAVAEARLAGAFADRKDEDTAQSDTQSGAIGRLFAICLFAAILLMLSTGTRSLGLSAAKEQFRRVIAAPEPSGAVPRLNETPESNLPQNPADDRQR